MNSQVFIAVYNNFACLGVAVILRVDGNACCERMEIRHCVSSSSASAGDAIALVRIANDDVALNNDRIAAVDELKAFKFEIG